MREACSRAMKRRWADPNERAALSQAVREGCLKPEVREERRNRGRIPEAARLACVQPEVRQRAAWSTYQRRFGWLPPEYRDEYFRLRRKYKYRAKEARRLIEKQIKKDLAHYKATGRLPQSERLEGVRT
jgi:hypothetical protein